MGCQALAHRGPVAVRRLAVPIYRCRPSPAASSGCRRRRSSAPRCGGPRGVPRRAAGAVVVRRDADGSRRRRAAGGVERPHPRPRVRRAGLAARPAGGAGLRQLGGPAGLPARSRRLGAGAADRRAAASPAGLPVRGPGARARRRPRSGGSGRRTTTAAISRATWSRCRSTARADAVREMVGGSDFLAAPRPSPDGRRVAWLAWDHPRMPWDGTELRVGALGRGRHRRAGDRPCSAARPSRCCSRSGRTRTTLYAVTDRTGWWNLHRLARRRRRARSRCARAAEEFGDPLWQLGSTTYGLLGDGRLLVRHGTDTDRARRARPGHRHADRPAAAVHLLAAAARPSPAGRSPAVAAGPRDGTGGGPGGRRRPARRCRCARRCADPAGPGLPAGAAGGHGARPRRAGRARVRLPAALAGRRGAGGRAAAVRGLRARRADQRTRRRCSTWRRRTSPAAASAWWTSTTAARPATGGPTGSGCAGSGAWSTWRTASPRREALVARRARRRLAARDPRRVGRRLDHARRAHRHRRLRRRHVATTAWPS